MSNDKIPACQSLRGRQNKFYIIFLTASLLLVSSSSLAQTDPQHTIKLGVYYPEGSIWINMCHDYERDVERATSGRVNIVWYTSGVMGDEVDMIRKIKVGQLQGGGFSGMGLAKIVPEVQLLELPFLFNSYDEVDYILEHFYPTFAKFFEDRGYILISWAEQGFIYYFAKVPLTSIEAIKDLKTWQWADHRLSEEIIRAVGIENRIPLRISDVTSSLPTTINAFYSNPLTAVALQWYIHAKYMLNLPLTYGIGGIIVQKKIYDTFPEEDRRLLIGRAKNYIKELKDAVRSENVVAIEGLRKHGIVINEPNQALISELKNRTRVVYKNLVDEAYSQALLDEVQSALANYREEKGHEKSH